ncbi:TetR/AcrR family transcriptional regulator [Nocardioides alcanivorans]|uniref:TetR/AcrR family transcriptional regulator n=1 Tax=Nocardioides alcanivorans TaxID=2897352 RepID=UPI001F331C75|nr:TetR/AcrR family transcriptional regulator [Nocardioides alcanivorans]
MGHDRRDAILEVAADLFAEKGIAATTVREIGDRAGVHSGSLYHWFKSKDAIVAELMADYLADIHGRFAAASAAAGSPREAVEGFMGATLAVIEDHPRPTAIYQQDRNYLRARGLLTAVDESSRGVREYWLSAIEDGVADGTFRDDVPAETFYRAVRDALWASSHWPVREQHTREEFAAQMIRLFLHGYLAER